MLEQTSTAAWSIWPFWEPFTKKQLIFLHSVESHRDSSSVEGGKTTTAYHMEITELCEGQLKAHYNVEDKE